MWLGGEVVRVEPAPQDFARRPRDGAEHAVAVAELCAGKPKEYVTLAGKSVPELVSSLGGVFSGVLPAGEL